MRNWVLLFVVSLFCVSCVTRHLEVWSGKPTLSDVALGPCQLSWEGAQARLLVTAVARGCDTLRGATLVIITPDERYDFERPETVIWPDLPANHECTFQDEDLHNCVISDLFSASPDDLIEFYVYVRCVSDDATEHTKDTAQGKGRCKAQ